MAAVGELKNVKAEYKSAVGSEYDEKKPPQAAALAAVTPAAAASSGSSPSMDLYNKCKAAGDAVRKLKSEKAGKDAVMAAVGELKIVKAEYKSAVGSEYDEKKPPQAAAPAAATAAAPAGSSPSMDLYNKCKAAGDAVRKLKSDKAGKDAVMAAVGELKIVKAEYKSVVGTEYDEKKPPQASAAVPTAANAVDPSVLAAFNKCKAAGDSSKVEI
jgi:bifunctional glutamyl/prolyl-tRNA synthetase